MSGLMQGELLMLSSFEYSLYLNKGYLFTFLDHWISRFNLSH